MASGVTAKVLHVDLSARQTRVEEIPEVTIRKYLGGGALACAARRPRSSRPYDLRTLKKSSRAATRRRSMVARPVATRT